MQQVSKKIHQGEQHKMKKLVSYESWVKYIYPTILFITVYVAVRLADPTYSQETVHILSFMAMLFGMLRGIILTEFYESEEPEQ